MKGFLAAKYVREAELLPWLRRFGERLLASNASNAELATRMILLRKLAIGEVGYVAHEIGMQLVRREEKINSPGSEEVDREANQSTQDEAEVWFNQGNQQYEVGDFLGAIASYDKAIAIQPDYYKARYKTGQCAERFGAEMKKPLVSYDKALAIQPDYYKARYKRGNALRDLGRK